MAHRDTLEEITLKRENQRAQLVKGNLKGQTWADLEAKAGVGDGTIRKFAKGSTEQPSLITLLSLSVVTASRESVR